MSRPNSLQELEHLLDGYAPSAAQRAAAVAFALAEAEAYESGKKRKCFLLMAASDAVIKAGEGRVCFR
jgi:hypothetical protein